MVPDGQERRPTASSRSDSPIVGDILTSIAMEVEGNTESAEQDGASTTPDAVDDVPTCLRTHLSASIAKCLRQEESASQALDEIEMWCREAVAAHREDDAVSNPFLLASLERMIVETICHRSSRRSRVSLPAAQKVAFEAVHHVSSLCTRLDTLVPTKCDALVQSFTPVDGLVWRRLPRPPPDGIMLPCPGLDVELVQLTEFSFSQLRALQNGDADGCGTTTLTREAWASFRFAGLRPNHFVEAPAGVSHGVPLPRFVFQPVGAGNVKLELIRSPCDTPKGAKELTRSDPLLRDFEALVGQPQNQKQGQPQGLGGWGKTVAPRIIHNKQGCWNLVLCVNDRVIGGVRACTFSRDLHCVCLFHILLSRRLPFGFCAWELCAS